MSPSANNNSDQAGRNLAARMGRWSASHWKTATFGWLAFVLVAFALGCMVGTKQVDQNAPGPGRVRPHAEDPRPELQATRRRERPDPEQLESRRRSRLQRCDQRRHRRRLEGRGRAERPRRAGRAEPALGAGRVRHPGRPEEGGGQGPACPRQRHRRPASPPRLRHRRVRSRERRQGRQHGVRQRSRKGREALASDHADRPPAHLRRARRGRHPAAAGADRRRRDLRADCASEPRRSGRAGGLRDGAPDRARRGRRLLDVLFEAGAAGTGRPAAARKRLSWPPPRRPAVRCSSPDSR